MLEFLFSTMIIFTSASGADDWSQIAHFYAPDNQVRMIHDLKNQRFTFIDLKNNNVVHCKHSGYQYGKPIFWVSCDDGTVHPGIIGSDFALVGSVPYFKNLEIYCIKDECKTTEVEIDGLAFPAPKEFPHQPHFDIYGDNIEQLEEAGWYWSRLTNMWFVTETFWDRFAFYHPFDKDAKVVCNVKKNNMPKLLLSCDSGNEITVKFGDRIVEIAGETLHLYGEL